jgi:aspartate/methionine/tyrosine aminotransferase
LSLLSLSAANLPADTINLGQGYMNFGPPKWVTDAAGVALGNVATNHYAHPKGCIRLREAIKAFYGPQLGRELNVETEIQVSSGANQGTTFEFPFPSRYLRAPWHRSIFGLHRVPRTR